MTREKLEEIKKLVEAETVDRWSAAEAGFNAAMRKHVLPLVKALEEAWKERDEARAEVERLREVVRQVHALVSGEMEWTFECVDYPIQEIHKITKGMVEGWTT